MMVKECNLCLDVVVHVRGYSMIVLASGLNDLSRVLANYNKGHRRARCDHRTASEK